MFRQKMGENAGKPHERHVAKHIFNVNKIRACAFIQKTRGMGGFGHELAPQNRTLTTIPSAVNVIDRMCWKISSENCLCKRKSPSFGAVQAIGHNEKEKLVTG